MDIAASYAYRTDGEGHVVLELNLIEVIFGNTISIDRSDSNKSILHINDTIIMLELREEILSIFAR